MKNRFTTTNPAMVLIDHQAGTINLARNIPRAEIVRNMCALARTAVENGMPLVLARQKKSWVHSGSGSLPSE